MRLTQGVEGGRREGGGGGRGHVGRAVDGLSSVSWPHVAEFWIFVEVQSESKCARLTGKRPRLNQRLMSELLSPPGGTPGLGLIQTEKDLVSGSIGGIAQVLVGQVSQPISRP